MYWLYIVLSILTLILITTVILRYWRSWPTQLEVKLGKLDKRSEDSCPLSLLESGLSHEEKEATG